MDFSTSKEHCSYSSAHSCVINDDRKYQRNKHKKKDKNTLLATRNKKMDSRKFNNTLLPDGFTDKNDNSNSFFFESNCEKLNSNQFKDSAKKDQIIWSQLFAGSVDTNESCNSSFDLHNPSVEEETQDTFGEYGFLPNDSDSLSNNKEEQTPNPWSHLLKEFVAPRKAKLKNQSQYKKDMNENYINHSNNYSNTDEVELVTQDNPHPISSPGNLLKLSNDSCGFSILNHDDIYCVKDSGSHNINSYTMNGKISLNETSRDNSIKSEFSLGNDFLNTIESCLNDGNEFSKLFDNDDCHSSRCETDEGEDFDTILAEINEACHKDYEKKKKAKVKNILQTHNIRQKVMTELNNEKNKKNMVLALRFLCPQYPLWSESNILENSDISVSTINSTHLLSSNKTFGVKLIVPNVALPFICEKKKQFHMNMKDAMNVKSLWSHNTAFSEKWCMSQNLLADQPFPFLPGDTRFYEVELEWLSHSHSYNVHSNKKWLKKKIALDVLKQAFPKEMSYMESLLVVTDTDVENINHIVKNVEHFKKWIIPSDFKTTANTNNPCNVDIRRKIQRKPKDCMDLESINQISKNSRFEDIPGKNSFQNNEQINFNEEPNMISPFHRPNDSYEHNTDYNPESYNHKFKHPLHDCEHQRTNQLVNSNNFLDSSSNSSSINARLNFEYRTAATKPNSSSDSISCVPKKFVQNINSKTFTNSERDTVTSITPDLDSMNQMNKKAKSHEYKQTTSNTNECDTSINMKVVIIPERNHSVSMVDIDCSAQKPQKSINSQNILNGDGNLSFDSCNSIFHANRINEYINKDKRQSSFLAKSNRFQLSSDTMINSKPNSNSQNNYSQNEKNDSYHQKSIMECVLDKNNSNVEPINNNDHFELESYHCEDSTGVMKTRKPSFISLQDTNYSQRITPKLKSIKKKKKKKIRNVLIDDIAKEDDAEDSPNFRCNYSLKRKNNDSIRKQPNHYSDNESDYSVNSLDGFIVNESSVECLNTQTSLLRKKLCNTVADEIRSDQNKRLVDFFNSKKSNSIKKRLNNMRTVTSFNQDDYFRNGQPIDQCITPNHSASTDLNDIIHNGNPVENDDNKSIFNFGQKYHIQSNTIKKKKKVQKKELVEIPKCGKSSQSFNEITNTHFEMEHPAFRKTNEYIEKKSYETYLISRIGPVPSDNLLYSNYKKYIEAQSIKHDNKENSLLKYDCHLNQILKVDPF